MIEKIIFLPFAGGNKYSYRSFMKVLQPSVKPVFVQLRGRGNRVDESFDETPDEMIDDIYQQCRDDFNGRYVIYGHSMGALLGFLLIKRLMSLSARLPLFLVATGFGAPSMLQYRKEKLHALSPELFWKKIADYGGTPADILDKEELRSIVEPALRSDIQMIENYIHDSSFRLNIPVLVITGESENVTEEEAAAWKHETTALVMIRKLKGNHFFILGNEKQITRDIFSFNDYLEMDDDAWIA